MMQTQIRLKNMRFHAYHGVLEQEKLTGNLFVVNLLITAPLESALSSDKLTDTLNYAEVYAVVKEQMEISSDLLEHVSGRILYALKEQFPTITAVQLEVSKDNPPFGGDVESASVIVNKQY